MIPHSGFVEIDTNSFLLTSGTLSNGFAPRVFELPNWVNMVHIIAVGGGGGGGAGAIGSGNALGGGGGGASGGILSVAYPAFVLPTRLFVTLGDGGTPGVAGGGTFVTASPGITSTSGAAGCIAFAKGGNAGAAGTTLIGGGAGGASSVMSTIQTDGQCPYVAYGIWSTRNSLAGTNGGYNSSSAEASFAFVSGGTGGGALLNQLTEFTAGQVNVGLGGNGTGTQPHSGVYTTNPQTGQLSDGAHGIISYKPLYFTGGIGGKAYAGGRGGVGGNGAPGCGGGGGGASSSAGGSSQLGGKGGDGFVVISYW